MEKYVIDTFTNEELIGIAERSCKLMNERLFGLNFFILYGSLARGEPSKDIDIILSSYDIEQEDMAMGSTKHSERFFKKLVTLVRNDDFIKYLTNGLLDIHLLHPNFFSDLEFRINFFKQLNHQDPFFFYNSIMRDGLLYSPNTGKFDIKASLNYDPIIQKSIQQRKKYNLSY